MEHDLAGHETTPGFWRSRYALGLIVIGAVAAYFLLTEHLAHLKGAWPFLLLLACPFMHVFMHHGHGGHGHQQAHAGEPQKIDLQNPQSPAKRGAP